MKFGSRNARLSAAVIAALCATSPLYADDLIWDPGMSATGGTDGSGSWDNSSATWYDSTTSTGPVAFNSGTPDSATFGTSATVTGTAQAAYAVLLGSNLTVNNLTFNGAQTSATTFTPYVIADDGSETLTLAGNLAKSAANGVYTLALSNSIALTSGVHTVSVVDTPGDAPELTSNSGFTGAGSLVMDNGAAGAYGTFVLNSDSNYTGTTAINNGRLVINTGNGVSTTAVSIGSAGTLSIGGAASKPNSTGFTVSNPITITRNTYTGTNFSDYPDALLASNTNQPGNVYTFAGPITIDSTDARIGAFTSNVVISGSLVAGPTVAAGTAAANFDGDFAGFVTLTGDNTAFGAAGGTIGILNGVELNVSSEANIGGPNSKLNLSGGEIHPTGALAAAGSTFMTNFGLNTTGGQHTIVNNTVSTGVDLDSTSVFTVNGLSGGGVGERGTGTLNFTGTNTFTGTPFFDGGTINFQAGSNTTQKGLRLRSPVVNIAGTLNVGGTYSSIGADSTGSAGQPDKATINITSGGSLISASGDDFNISDNANTAGTINMSGTAVLTTGGNVFMGKSAGAVGTVNLSGGTFTASAGQVFDGQNNGTGSINQTGGSLVANHQGNFGFVISDGRNRLAANAGTVNGTYSLSGSTSTFSSPKGEVYVGEGGNGNGLWNQTGGTATFGSYFVVGREGALGTLNLSGGTLTKTGTVGADTSFISVGEGSLAHTSSVNITNGAVFTENDGEFYIGNGSGAGVVNVGQAADLTNPTLAAADAASSLTVNNWFAVGRSGNSTGTLNIYAGSVTQATANYLDLSGAGGSSTGTVNVYGGKLTAFQTIIGENGSGTGILNVNGGTTTLQTNTVFARGDTAKGVLNLNAGTLNAAGFTAGVKANTTFNFNGGNLVAALPSGTTANTNFIGANVTSVVSAGGAIINPNANAVTINAALTHNAAVTGADGGLTVANASTTAPGGTVTLAAVNTYTGPTTVTGSANLAIASTGSIATTTLNSTTAIANAGTITESGGGSIDSLTGAGTLNITGGTLNLTNPVITTTASATSSQAAVTLAGTGKLNIGTSSIAVATGQYANLVSEYKAATLYSSNQQARTSSRVIGIVDNGTNTIAKYTAIGDVNLDGKFSIADVAAINGAGNFGGAAGTATYTTGDVNYDGRFTISDVAAINGAGTFGGGTITNVATISPNVVAQTIGNATIDMQYDPATGNLTIVTNGLTYGVVGLSSTASVFAATSGTSPEFYEGDTGFDFGFGVLTGQQTQTVVLPGVIDKGLTLATLLQDVTVDYNTSGTATTSQFTFSGGLGSVPEPASLSLFGLAAGAMVRRRRRAR